MNPISTLLLFPIQPRRVALAHARTPLWNAYLIHALGLLTLAGIVVALNPYLKKEIPDLRTWETSLLGRAHPIANLLIVLGVGETIFVVVASAMVCWSGREEPFRDSWSHALRMSWLYVAHLPWLLTTITGLFIVAPHLENVIPLGVRVLAMLTAISAIICASIASYLRALTAPRPTPPTPSPPDLLCEWCGYNLAYLDQSGRCPECGRPITDSVDPTIRSPLSATLRQSNARARTLLLRAWVNPEPLFRSIETRSHLRIEIRLFVACLAATALLAGGTGVATLFPNVGPRTFKPRDFIVLVSILIMMGMFIAWVCFMLASLVASALGHWAGRRRHRNCLKHSLRTVLLTSGLLPLWAAIAMAGFVQTFMFGRNPALQLAFAAANAVVGFLYVVAVAKRIRYLQYANR